MYRYAEPPATARHLTPRSTTPAEAFLAGWCPRTRVFKWPGGGSLRFKRTSTERDDSEPAAMPEPRLPLAQLTAFGQVWCIDGLAQQFFAHFGLDVRNALNRTQASAGEALRLDPADRARLDYLLETGRNLLSALRTTACELNPTGSAQPPAHMLSLRVEWCPDTFESARAEQILSHTLWGSLEAWQALAQLFESTEKNTGQPALFDLTVDVRGLTYEGEAIIGHLTLDRTQAARLSSGGAMLLDDYAVDAEGALEVDLHCPSGVDGVTGPAVGWQLKAAPRSTGPGSPSHWHILEAAPVNERSATGVGRHALQADQHLERFGQYRFRISAGRLSVRFQHLLNPPPDWQPGGVCHAPAVHLLDSAGQLAATGRLVLIDARPALQLTSALSWPSAAVAEI